MGSDDEVEDNDGSTATPVALPPSPPPPSSSSDDDDADGTDDDDDFADIYCKCFSDENDDDFVHKSSIDKFSEILQTAAISAGLFTGQPGATCCVSASDTFQNSSDGKIVRDFIKQGLVGIDNPPG